VAIPKIIGYAHDSKKKIKKRQTIPPVPVTVDARIEKRHMPMPLTKRAKAGSTYCEWARVDRRESQRKGGRPQKETHA